MLQTSSRGGPASRRRRSGAIAIRELEDVATRWPGVIGGQPRADFFQSLHESAKSAFGRLFADFFL
jgi:hypothetical protein